SFDINGISQTLGLVTNGATITNSNVTAATLTIGNGSTGAGAYTGKMNVVWNQGGASSSFTGSFTNTGNLTLNANGAGTIGLSAVNNPGTILNSGSTTAATTISGTIGANVTGITENSAGSNLILSGANTAYAGATTLTLGTLTGLNSGTTNVLQAFGTGQINLNGGTLQLRADGNGNTQTIAVGNNVVVGGNTTINVDRNTANTGNTFSMGTLSIGAHQLNVTGANGYALSFGATTLTGNATFNPTTANLTLGGAIGESGGSRSLTKSGAGALTLSGANTFSGGLTLNAGTLNLGSTTA